EYFVTSDGEMYFGEVAYRPPGFKVFELLERVYGFNAYQASMLVFDPKSTKEEVAEFFPKEIVDANGFAGCFGVYPRRR
ncbi:carboxylate--amine ligase, partial [Planococcus sp. SIMBA_160]